MTKWSRNLRSQCSLDVPTNLGDIPSPAGRRAQSTTYDRCGRSRTRERFRMSLDDEYKPRYQWRRTWPDTENHFTGFDGKWTVGRIHAHHTGNWLWFAGLSECPHGPALCPASGSEATARLAAKAAEDCYDRMLRGEWPRMSDRVKAIAISLADREGRARGNDAPNIASSTAAGRIGLLVAGNW